jgi:lysine 2,3-aminomutase
MFLSGTAVSDRHDDRPGEKQIEKEAGQQTEKWVDRPAERQPEKQAGQPDPVSTPPHLPFVITSHLRSLIDSGDPEDPVGRQFIPNVLERSVCRGESPDPLGERRAEAVPGLLHRYPDRVLVLVTDRCAAYCRFCFRRESAGRGLRSLGERQLRGTAAYVAAHPEVREVILSGGDPLMLSTERLLEVLAAFRGLETVGPAPARRLAFRLHTRVPVALPGRITPRLVERLGSLPLLRLVVQVNHPRELAPECVAALRRFQEAGVATLSQGVLLRGVNDDPRVLAELWKRLAAGRIRPHHLFQMDLARGTGHFRVDLQRALAIYRDAVRMVAAKDAVPDFALDLPGGGGKVLLPDCNIYRHNSGYYRVESPDGRSALYPIG